MRIHCPWCGPRPLQEFHYGGDATKKRPQDPEKATHQDWVDYHFIRDNPAGDHMEYWHHTSGCRAWLVVMRDTRTHQIGWVEYANPSPQRDGK